MGGSLEPFDSRGNAANFGGLLSSTLRMWCLPFTADSPTTLGLSLASYSYSGLAIAASQPARREAMLARGQGCTRRWAALCQDRVRCRRRLPKRAGDLGQSATSNASGHSQALRTGPARENGRVGFCRVLFGWVQSNVESALGRHEGSEGRTIFVWHHVLGQGQLTRLHDLFLL